MKYKVTFYQCGVTGIEDERFCAKKTAQRNAVEFLQSFTGALKHGHKYSGSVYRDGYARIVDMMGATEALAEVHTL